jgi:hypothetical protein
MERKGSKAGDSPSKESERCEFFSEKEQDARHGSKPEGDMECYYYRYSKEWDLDENL